MELFARIHADTAWTYMIVDIGNGRKWLLSRLFLFTAILQQMGFLKCVVFVETRRGLSRRFLGTATPERVYAVLSKKYQWLARALKRSYFAPSQANLALALQQPSPNPESIKTALQSAVPLNGMLPKQAAETIVNAFMADTEIRWNQAGDPPQSEWEKINEIMNVWEHTKWLNLDRFNGDLREALDDPRASWMVDGPDASKEKRIRGLLRRDVRYVALVNQRMEFLELFDREPLVKRFLAKQSETEGSGD
jgi:hypothetical protein